MGGDVRTVLIVDDDPQILRLVEKMLKPRAIKVLMAPRAADALRICEQEPVHLLISDVAMPEMDGNKLADRVLRLYPEASVLLISGHYKDLPEVKTERLRYLRKPFFPSELIRHLREMLPELGAGGQAPGAGD
jgi:DNA-binding NtrC family response regulator